MASNISNKWRNLVETSSGSSTKEKDPASSKKLPEIEGASCQFGFRYASIANFIPTSLLLFVEITSLFDAH